MNRKKGITIMMIALVIVLAAALVLALGGIAPALGSYPNADRYTAGDAVIDGTVKHIDVDWVNGRVVVARHSGDTVTLAERSDREIGEAMRLRWWLDGDTLRVRFAAPGIRLSWNQEKELTLTLPEDIALGEVRIHATSGALDIPSLACERLDLGVTSGDVDATASATDISVGATSGRVKLTVADGAQTVDVGTTSGTIAVQAGTVGRLTLSNTSGGITAAAERADEVTAGSTSGSVRADLGEAGRVTLTSTSGTVTANMQAGPAALTVHTTSGSVALALPQEPGFTAELHTVSGRIDFGLPLSRTGSDYVCGDGSGSVEVHTTSGGIRLDPVQP